ncbi:MAG: mannosyltransferase family protein, partial [Pyrinomonadaceae bacterium]
MDRDRPRWKEIDSLSEKIAENSVWKRALSLLSKRDWLVVAWVLAIKALLFIFAVKSYQVLEDKRVAGGRGWLELWNRWDALHYQKLAQFGYSATGEMRPSMVFYPLLPWLMRLLTTLTGDYLVSALLISGVASVAAAVLLRRLVRLDYPSINAQRAVWFLLIFPTAYFLHIGYTESLFLTLALGCILAARKELWWLAGLLGALSCMTRATGLVLVPTLCVEAAHQFWITRRWRLQWLWLLIVPLGFGVYLMVNLHAAGDAFAFLPIRKEFFYISLSWPWVGVSEAIGALGRTPAQAEMVGAQELFFITLGFICTIASWIKLRPLYATWMTCNWLLFTSVTFVASVPRYTLTLFPIFILFAMLAASRFWNAVITVWSLLFLALFS